MVKLKVSTRVLIVYEFFQRFIPVRSKLVLQIAKATTNRSTKHFQWNIKRKTFLQDVQEIVKSIRQVRKYC